MKKLYHSRYQIIRSARRSKKEAKRKIRFKKHIKTKNKKSGNKAMGMNKRIASSRSSDEKLIVAPKYFSFRNHPNEMIDFVSEVEACLERKQKVFVTMKKVKVVDHDALLVFISAIARFKDLGLSINGDFPKNPDDANVLRKSGFLEHVYQRNIQKDGTKYKMVLDNIITHSWKDVDSELGKQVISSATEKIWGKKKRCQGVQRTLIELMQNTNNHASPEKEGEKHWWLSVNYDEKDKVVRFCFVDYGVGIIKSLESKKNDSKFYKVIDNIRENTIGDINNDRIIRMLMDGDIHKKYVKVKYYRGKGLPGIKEAMDRNQLSKLYIITNNVFADVQKNEYKLTARNFKGTFVYWELSIKNRCCDGKND